MKKENEIKRVILRGFTIPEYATLTKAPIKTERFGDHWEIVFGIGNNHVAFFTIDDKALKAYQSGEPVHIK